MVLKPEIVVLALAAAAGVNYTAALQYSMERLPLIFFMTMGIAIALMIAAIRVMEREIIRKK